MLLKKGHCLHGVEVKKYKAIEYLLDIRVIC
jgi:hypothetical protein